MNKLRKILKKFYIEKRTEVTALNIEIKALDQAEQQIKNIAKNSLPKLSDLHELWFKTTKQQITITIANGLRAIHERLMKILPDKK